MKVRVFIWCSFLFFLLSCGNPLEIFYDELRKYGYIPYSLPMQAAGTGTMVGGSPKSMSIIAHPKTCFPDIDEYDIRFRDDSVLPTTQVNFFVDTNIRASFMKALSAGAPSIKAGLKLNSVSNMELTFSGVHVEYFDSVRLFYYYRDHVPEVCREYLDRVGFVIQAIVVDQMRFSLYTRDGGQVELSVDNINQYFDLAVNTKWQIDHTASLIITTPKYIGYQLGELRKRNQGLILRRATKVVLDKWVFSDEAIFSDEY